MELGEAIKQWRAAAGITQPKAAELLGMPLRTIQHIEQGRPFTYDAMMRLAIEALKGRGHGA